MLHKGETQQIINYKVQEAKGYPYPLQKKVEPIPTYKINEILSGINTIAASVYQHLPALKTDFETL